MRYFINFLQIKQLKSDTSPFPQQIEIQHIWILSIQLFLWWIIFSNAKIKWVKNWIFALFQKKPIKAKSNLILTKSTHNKASK